MQYIPVTFRFDNSEPNPEVVAIFLSQETHPANSGNMMCYAHVGQHAECSIAWAKHNTREATVEEYTPLLRELEQIYNDAENQLLVQEWHPWRHKT